MPLGLRLMGFNSCEAEKQGDEVLKESLFIPFPLL